MSNNAYELVTRRLLDLIRSENCLPWRMPWMSTPAQNIVSGKSYRGINRLLLASKTAETGCPYFASFRQVKAMGGHVKKGSKSEIVVFWKLWKREEKVEDAYSDGTETVEVELPIMKYCRVFSLADCGNVEYEIPELPNRDHEPHEEAERIVRDFVENGGPALNIGGTEAVYSPTRDSVGMPAPETFESDEAFYGTLFHEIVHSTGHHSRLNREDLGARFGSKRYSREELTAELGSAFLESSCGLLSDREENQSAGYLHHWISVLENDDRAAVIAASRAEKAVEFIRNAQKKQEREELRAA
jgi:antirestriction protein ArdC